MRRAEKEKIEKPLVRRALKELGVPSIPIKLVAGSDTGRPDQMFLIPGGKPLFIELKWPGFTSDPKQVYWHTVLTALGYEVQVHDEIETALEAIRSACARIGTPKNRDTDVERRKRRR